MTCSAYICALLTQLHFLIPACETTIKGFRSGMIKKENVIINPGIFAWGKKAGQFVSVSNSMSQRSIMIDLTKGDTAKLETVVKVTRLLYFTKLIFLNAQ